MSAPIQSQDHLKRFGYALLHGVFDRHAMNSLADQLSTALQDRDVPTTLRSRGRIYGSRNLIDTFPQVCDIPIHPVLREFITSVLGDSVLLYPLPAWEEIEARLAELPSTDRTKQRFLERVGYYGQQAQLDAQGRVVIPQLLRESAEMTGEVVVSARLNYLEVWNHQRLQARFAEQPFTEEDFGNLTDKGI